MNRAKYISLMTVAIAVIAIGMEFVMKRFFPSVTSLGYLIVPLFYWLFYALSAIFLFRNCKPGQLVKIHMVIKGLKMILSLFFLLIISLVMHSDVVAVIVNFLVYSTLLLVPESYGFISLKKRIQS